MAKPYYGLTAEAPVFEGMSQYRDPLNYELCGKRTRLVFDDGQTYIVNFLSGSTLSWSRYGAQGSVEYYECAKIADAYFVNFELADAPPRVNITLVLDAPQRLVTMVITKTDYDEQYPYMCESEYFFGYIDTPGYPAPKHRHAFTADLVGKRIHWHYNPGLEIIHVYYCTDYCRVTFPPATAWGDASPEEWEAMLERAPYDEKAAYIKVRDGLYLVSVLEQNMSRRGLTGNSLLFLIDAKRVHDVGRSFGHAGLQEGNVHGENYIFGAYGNFVYSDGKLEAKPNIYLQQNKPGEVN
ncbi:MAG: MoaF N-terminal domain-containing protein [Clostridiales bacterium]|nr:MoaF N-terminal domain-containing protein [Clostridiales bacterium]